MASPDSSALPEALAHRAALAWERILERASEQQSAALAAALEDPALAAEAGRVLGCSVFVAELARRRPALLLELFASGDLGRSLADDAWETALAAALAAPDVEPADALRRFRQRHMLRIVWRDFCRSADTLETVRDTSLLADACIRQALAVCSARLEARHGRPLGRRSGARQELIVLAMGKLGARELNVSSDIDLVFAYPESGDTDGDEKPLSNEEFFTRVGRALINLLDQVTAEGFVFRVDMRLRPYGDSGSLVHNFAALEEYYQDQGRDWERYALIKARPVTGDPARAAQLMSMLRPFVFRRYVDFGVIESLRGMKQMIVSEVRRRGLDDNVKLGRGGIREVEFIAQCFQLIRGGRDRGLQQRELLPVLAECVELDILPAEAAAELRSAYLFLRDSEHAIQGYEDRQTQALPHDDTARLAMATVMGFADWEGYVDALTAHRSRVADHFANLIADPDAGDEEPAESVLPWDDSLSAGLLEAQGYRQGEQTLQRLVDLRDSRRVLTLQAEGKERLQAFMPQLLQACLGTPDPDLALERVLPLVVAVLRRSAYFAMLLENPPAMHELVVLCGASPWIAEQLARHPVLLDELLDRASLYTAPDRAALEDDLRQQVARLPIDDLEAQMDALRYFKASHVLRVAASELADRLPLMKVSDKLTFIAEVILEQVIAIAWADLVAKYGEPERDSSGYGLAVYGYGKLGGIELGYGSDLDLVLVQDSAPQGSTEGPRSIDNVMFYTRLGQRMIHILEARMPLGQLYEVDMRLRPSGESGMLVTTCQGFRSYQSDSAWTWEHQALVRARFVAGDPAVAERVDAVRHEVLCQSRDADKLKSEVTAMRRRMREHQLPGGDADAPQFNLKQGTGGIVDIEFMVQYAVLAWAHRVPELVKWSDNVRILETLGREGLFAQRDCDLLTEAYLAYRSASHQLALQQLPGVVEAGQFAAERDVVSGCWQALFGDADDSGEEQDKMGENNDPG